METRVYTSDELDRRTARWTMEFVDFTSFDGDLSFRMGVAGTYRRQRLASGAHL